MQKFKPLWTEKYRPTKTEELIGNEEEIKEIIKHLKTWEKGDEPLIIYGPPGVGKTTAAKVISEDLGYSYVETDASDERTGEKVKENIKAGTSVSGFMGELKVAIVDEADNLDRGGARAMHSVFEDPAGPIILIANEYYDMSQGIRNKCKGIEFDFPDPGHIYQLLVRIAEEEGEDYRQGQLQEIASECDGDVRGAVTDLHSLLVGYDDYNKFLEKEYGIPPKNVFLGEESGNIQRVNKALDTFFSGKQDRPWVIRGMQGFELAVAEYANNNDIPYELHLPKHEDELTESWNEIDQIRLDEVIKNADSVQHVFMYDEDINWREYEKWTMNEHDRVYTWVENGNTEVSDMIGSTVANTVNLVDFV